MKNSFTRLIIKGGVLSPAELKNIVVSAENLGLNSISFGSRQDIIFPVELTPEQLEELEKFEIVKPGDTGKANIVSSYVASDIFPGTPWLTGERYLYILEQFRYQPDLKINIADQKQRLVPLFTGHLNFIASSHEDYWYLYIRMPDWEETQVYPALINSWDIAKVSFEVEKLVQEEPETIEMIFDLVNDSADTNNRTINEPLRIPFYPFPYFEGMNRVGNDKYWLGLYWRNNLYDLKFLKAMCNLCAECKIGKICITPWKSFIVKGIPMEYKLTWEKMLGKFGLNVRHSMLELNWHLPVANEWALKLKKFLVQNFDENDISTYGLTFAITNYSKKSYYFTSVVIEKNPQPTQVKGFKIRNTYNLLYAKNFDPNTREYIVHVQDIDKVELPGILMELSQMYFEQLGTENEEEVKTKENTKEEIEAEVYQCRECLTIYDPAYGDVTQNIKKGILFEDLPHDYICSLCESPKSSFQKKKVIKQVG
ncbi:rubredoxin [Abyssalbus ytuae]|uniref:Rubredoxin n=1 Tax=Abyssalbus ytuae TaxID=2926907 RepID=A0A9E6ZLN0_9FLAO|nr:rubredoxin [Abyssalbus ytuae]UOB18074.1 rubredoxin [Abyssalbus ytuae]